MLLICWVAPLLFSIALSTLLVVTIDWCEMNLLGVCVMTSINKGIYLSNIKLLMRQARGKEVI